VVNRASLLNDARLVFLESIEVLSRIDGTTYYGPHVVSGVILIRTRK
jgi:hypothetical protein